MQISDHYSLASLLSDLFAKLDQVGAVAWGGSQINGIADPNSDIDLYVYTRSDIPLASRHAIVDRSGGASRMNLGLNYWGAGDEWYHAPSGIEIDVIYFDMQWMGDQLHNMIDRFIASLGYTTCLWHIIRHSKKLYDPLGWFETMQQKAKAEYPVALRKNIITLNHPVLREVIPSYRNQLAKAVMRGDLVSINHRLAAFLASYFDIIFAVNCQLHPGEKRLIDLAQSRCARLPENMKAGINALIQSASAADTGFLHHLDSCLDYLDRWLEQEGLLPPVKSR